jgi:hypothetical protein
VDGGSARERESTRSEGKGSGRKIGGEISAFYRAREGEERTPGKRKQWPAMALRPLMRGSNGEVRNDCVKAP